jgi:hypothetical protein
LAFRRGAPAARREAPRQTGWHVPSIPIPGLDAVIDIGAPIALLWFWWTFFRDARRGGSKASASRETPESG